MTALSDWIEKHRCTYDIQPILEMDEGQAGHVGFELNVHAEFPVSAKLTADDGKRLDEIRDKLGEIIDLLVPKDSEDARFELVPFRRSVRFSSGAGKNPKVTRTVRIFHLDYAAVEPSDRQKLEPAERRLQEMGVQKA
jgi:hypothetical protein